MDRADLYEQWQANKDRAAWVREHREALMTHTDVTEPIPTTLAGVADWLDRYKGTVTRQLNDDSDGTDPQDSEVAA